MNDHNSISDKKKQNVSKTFRILGHIIAVCSVLFLIVSYVKLNIRLRDILEVKGLGIAVIVGILIKTITVMITGSAWYDWLMYLSSTGCHLFETLRVYLKANIGKYFPGNFMHYVGRNVYARELDIPQKEIAISSFIEIILLVFSSLLLSIILAADELMSVFNELFVSIHFLLYIFFIIACIALVVVYYLRKRIGDNLKKRGLLRLILTITKSIVKYMLAIALLGIIMVLLYDRMNDGWIPEDARLIISAYAIAWMMGYVIPGAPGGIGVRELVLTFLLSKVMDASMLLKIVLIHRVITIIGDFVGYAVCFLPVFNCITENMISDQGKG